MHLRLVVIAGLAALLVGIVPTTAEAAPLTAKQQAAANVAKAYSDNVLRMTTFTLEKVNDNGTFLYVDAVCTRTTTARGATTTSKQAIRFVVTVQPPPRGKTTGMMVVTSVTTRTIR